MRILFTDVKAVSVAEKYAEKITSTAIPIIFPIKYPPFKKNTLIF